MSDLTVSVTELGGFRDCRRKFFLSEIMRLEPKVPATYFWFGDVFHAALEAFYKGLQEGMLYPDAVTQGKKGFEVAKEKILKEMEAEYQGLWSEMEPSFLEDLKLCEQMVGNYLIRENLSPVGGHGKTIVSVEERYFKEFTTPQGKKATLTGRFDLTLRDRSELLWVTDHKSAKSKPWMQGIDLDDQLTGYVWLYWKVKGEKPEGAIYNVALKQGIEIEILKSGKVSKNKQQKVTFYHFLAQLQNLGLPLGEYEEFLAELKKRGWSDFFVREAVLRTENELRSFERRLGHAVDDLLNAKEYYEETGSSEKFYPNPGQFKCRGCPFVLVCKGMEMGDDVESLIEHKYKPKPARY